MCLSDIASGRDEQQQQDLWLLLTAHVGVVNDRLAPKAAAIILVGTNPKLVLGVGLQVIDHRVAGWTRLVDPLPVPLPVSDGVESERDDDL